MKVDPIISSTNNLRQTFKGYTVEDGGGVHLNAAFDTGRRYEKTLDSFHKNKTYRIYYADPLEKVTDKIRENVDFVFYDDPPKFPDIENETSKMYFFDSYPAQEAAFRKQIKDFKDYHYRLEMADGKTVGYYENNVWNNIDKDASRAKADYFKAHVADAKYNQETAAQCEAIFDEAKGMIDNKNKIYSNINNLQSNIRDREADLPMAKKELEQRTLLGKFIETKISDLKNQKSAFESLDNDINISIENFKKGENIADKAYNYNVKNHASYGFNKNLCIPTSTEVYQKVQENCKKYLISENKTKEEISARIGVLESMIEQYSSELEANRGVIQNLTSYIKKLPSIISDLKKDLASNVAAYDKAKADLIIPFDKLKDCFYKRGIRHIR